MEWNKPIRGANVFSELSLQDLKSAKAAGINVIRIGAVGQHQDLEYLVKDGSWDFSKNNKERLVASIKRAKEANLKVILTLSEVPGRKWEYEKHDFRIFEDLNFHKKLIEGWLSIAQLLVSYDHVIGYDILNEPLFPEEVSDKQINYKQLKSKVKGTARDVNYLYQQIIEAIRSIDKMTPIILQPTRWGSRKALDIIEKQNDQKVIYSVHYYDPFPFFAKRKNKGFLKYPGLIPDWVSEKSKGSERRWSHETHLKELLEVKLWANENLIPMNRIFIGEFGVWREAPGADRYLKDVLRIFDEMGWHWTYYSYRERGWDNTNLELSDVNGKQGKLFEIIKPYLR